MILSRLCLILPFTFGAGKNLWSRVFRPPEPGYSGHVNIQAAPAEQLNSILHIDIRIAGHYTLP